MDITNFILRDQFSRLLICMKPVKTLTVVASLPEKLKPLQDLAYNLCWTWMHEARDLFWRLDPNLWEATGHNPVRMLGTIIQPRLNALAKDEGFVAQLNHVLASLTEYMSVDTWYDKTYGKVTEPQIAYFSAEYAVTECLPIYSGGLGVLAGDHLKSAAEMGLPLVGVGLLYRVGYFHQYLNEEGWQGETYPPTDFYELPIELIKGANGLPLQVSVEYPGRMVKAQVWKAQVGRVPLYLLDTDIADNSDADRRITRELYGGDQDTRIQQEIMLGIGGLRMLEALKIHPTVFHMNEGHSAFLALERTATLMEEHKLLFDEARELSRAGNLFTTHTPVPAGIDVFTPALMDRYFSQFAQRLGISMHDLLALGRQGPNNPSEGFSMAVAALRMANITNGVSKLHAVVSRSMWQSVWPRVPDHEIPITSITNGIHHRTWISKDLTELFLRYMGPRWIMDPSDHTVWQMVSRIPDEELWGTHSRRRERLVAFARRRLRAQLMAKGASPAELTTAEEVLDPRTLTIGFARRFATYKRATMLFFNPDRLEKILNNKERPVQIIFAGKAHPKDTPGKDLIKRVVQFAQKEQFRQKIVFIEDYDEIVARYLVQGADVWLNTPRRPLEASGTSGMKAAANGVINLSILDGWWDEAYSPSVGWAIGRRDEVYPDQNIQDASEANMLYNLLEEEIVPMFYDVGKDTVPNRWIQKMKGSMGTLCPFFNTNRMVREYLEKMYLPSMKRIGHLSKGKFERARKLAKWKYHLKSAWGGVGVDQITSEPSGEVPVGAEIKVRARVILGNMEPSDVSVQIYEGRVNTEGDIIDPGIMEMENSHSNPDGTHTFTGIFKTSEAGLYGITVRVLPKNEDLSGPFEPALIIWAR